MENAKPSKRLLEMIYPEGRNCKVQRKTNAIGISAPRLETGQREENSSRCLG
jgi:hypothetical protein